MAPTGRRLFLIICLILALSAQGSAQFNFGSLPSSLPVIVQISPTANITSIASVLGATVVDNIPDTTIYLLNVPTTLSSLTGSLSALLGIQWIEVNTGVSIPEVAVLKMVTVPGTVAPDWYKN